MLVANSIAPAIMAGASYDSVVLSDSPISYWETAETSGTAAADSADSNPGTYTGGFTLAQAGPTGLGNTGVLLNGTTGYIAVADAANIRLTPPMSIEYWINYTSLTGFPVPISKGSATVTDFKIFTSSSGTIQFSAGGSNAGGSTTGITAGVWSHVVVTHDGTTIRYYLQGAANGTSGTIAVATSTNGLRWGTDTIGGSFLNGLIAKPALYNTVLSATRVAAHYNAAAGSSVPRSSLGLVTVQSLARAASF